jgi:uncharacterized Tic20 family protein
MTFNLRKFILAIVVWIAVALVLILFGSLLSTMKAAPLTAVGAFLDTWAWVLGFLAGLWYYFAGPA